MTFYTADLHFGHKNIIKYCTRPFFDVDHMAFALIEQLNECDDEVWILGDFAFYGRNKVESILDLIEVPLVLVRGNHDANSTVKAFESRGFAVYDSFAGHMAGRAIQMSHYPYTGDSQGEDRFEGRRPKDRGEVLLHGHVHDEWQVNGRQVNLGWDAWHKILSQEDLDTIITTMVR